MTSMIGLGILATVGVFLAVLFTTLAIKGMLREKDDDYLFEEKLKQINQSELSEDKKGSINLGWYPFWEAKFQKTGRLVSDPGMPGNIALGVTAFFLAFGALVFPGGILGAAIMPFAGIAGYFAILGSEAKKRAKTLETQMPNLLSSLRSNLQSRATPQQALINVANDFPAPLGDELRVVRDDMSVNVPMDKALQALAARTGSNEIKFLVASIEIAVESGADLDTQLETIEGIVRQRREISEKLSVAISQAMPSIWVTAIFIPAGLIFNFIQSEDNRVFWTSFFGIVALGVVAVLYVGGLFWSWKNVKGVENT